MVNQKYWWEGQKEFGQGIKRKLGSGAIASAKALQFYYVHKLLFPRMEIGRKLAEMLLLHIFHISKLHLHIYHIYNWILHIALLATNILRRYFLLNVTEEIGRTELLS